MLRAADATNGHPKLAAHMGVYLENAIFSRFGELAARNLLYYQAELVELTIDLREVEQRDHADNDEEKKGYKYAVNWYYLNKSKSRPNPKQYETVMKIGEKLAEYQEALLRAHRVANLSDPAPSDLHDLQLFLQDPDGMELCLTGFDRDVWGSIRDPSSRAPDLAVLRARNHEDLFSRLVRKLMGPFFRHIAHRYKKDDPVHGFPIYKDRRLLQLTHLIATIIASSIVVSSIIVLYYIESVGKRLGAIAGFNIFLSLCLHVFSTGKRIKIFAATSAFAAVQVVFVSSQIGSGYQPSDKI
ncbi:hypothetical protein EJ08DRAFT_100480 [Tothia fuscella]|uniref:DUF6594 domain-containing protein n=1 Tax=Tothia fuscella TaxID=1048955 RepID=A0A9P4U0X1_9PEZI|nr:hypothetical protein EJ08DRAFT_100480 [Tothia fuscella]